MKPGCSPLAELDEERRGDTSLETFDDPEELERRKATNAFLKFEKELESGKISKRLENLKDDDEDEEDDLTERLALLDPGKRFSSSFTKSFAKAMASQTRMMKDIGRSLEKMGSRMVRQFG